MGFNLLKTLKRGLNSKNLLVKIAVVVLIFWVFGQLTKMVGLEGFASGDTLTYFYMNGCPHCKTFAPIWDAFSGAAKVKTTKVEANEMTAAHKSLGVQGFPTVLLLNGQGKKKATFNGNRTVAGLNAFIKSVGLDP